MTLVHPSTLTPQASRHVVQKPFTWSRRLCLAVATLMMAVAVLRSGVMQYADVAAAKFPNPDSYYKLVLLGDRVDGEGFSLVARDNAPSGNQVHWSLPHSWTVWQLHRLLAALGLDEAAALIWAGALLTCLSMLALALLVALAVSNVSPLRSAAITGLLLATNSSVLGYGQLIQITHHIFMLVPLAAAAACLLRTTAHDNFLITLAGGLCLGLAVWISPETMPFVVSLAAVRAAMRLEPPHGAPVWPLALGMALVMGMGWAIDPPPPTFDAWALDHISLSWLLFCGLLAVVTVLADALAAARAPLRLSLPATAVAAVAAAAAWLRLVPGALDGPSGLMPAQLKPLFWDTIRELKSVGEPSGWVAYAVVPLVAAALMGRAAWRDRRLWMLVLCLAILAYAVLGAWHVRMGAAASVMAALAFGIGAGRLRVFSDGKTAHLPLREQWVGVALTLLGPIVIGAAIGMAELEPARKPIVCPLKDVANELNALPPATMLAPVFSGPELLYRTHHRVIAGPYHHNVQGILDNYRAWLDTDDRTARAIIGKRGIEYVLGCTNFQKQLGGTAGKPSLAKRVADGEAPDWLEPIALHGPADAPWRLYRVLATSPAVRTGQAAASPR
ncbi:MAG: hypothetical protein ACT4P0_08875 [Panacagrimonas sp.]